MWLSLCWNVKRYSEPKSLCPSTLVHPNYYFLYRVLEHNTKFPRSAVLVSPPRRAQVRIISLHPLRCLEKNIALTICALSYWKILRVLSCWNVPAVLEREQLYLDVYFELRHNTNMLRWMSCIQRFRTRPQHLRMTYNDKKMWNTLGVMTFIHRMKMMQLNSCCYLLQVADLRLEKHKCRVLCIADALRKFHCDGCLSTGPPHNEINECLLIIFLRTCSTKDKRRRSFL